MASVLHFFSFNLLRYRNNFQKYQCIWVNNLADILLNFFWLNIEKEKSLLGSCYLMLYFVYNSVYSPIKCSKSTHTHIYTLNMNICENLYKAS